MLALDPSRPVSMTGPGGHGPPGRAPVVGDESCLRQVAANLVGNAIAHTPAGTPVRIGVGVADGEVAGRVFERFYRADASRSRSPGRGAGLGLTIARSLVAAHGGRVDLVTSPRARRDVPGDPPRGVTGLRCG